MTLICPPVLGRGGSKRTLLLGLCGVDGSGDKEKEEEGEGHEGRSVHLVGGEEVMAKGKRRRGEDPQTLDLFLSTSLR